MEKNLYKIETHDIYQPYYQKNRRIRILLPNDYENNDSNRYPVLYIHDGQNVYFDEESFASFSWRLPEILSSNEQLPKMLVVAIDNDSDQRLNEYSPWQGKSEFDVSLKQFGGDGEQYAEWIVQVVKPFIDAHYRTKSDFKNSLLVGSSMGAFITAYTAAKYPEVFGKLGIFSLASWFNEEAFLAYLKQHAINKETSVYIQVGTKETEETTDPNLNNHKNQNYINCSLRLCRLWLDQNLPINQLWLNIFVEESHHERYWFSHFVEFLEFVFKEN